MKRIIMITVMIASMLFLLAGCTKTCYNCGESLNGKGYTAFGNDYCNDCFMYDLGL